MSKLNEDIIIRYLENRCSEEDFVLINEWMKESDGNAGELFRMEEIYQLGKFPFEKDDLVTKAERRLGRRLEQENQKKQKVFKLRNMLRYAAAIVAVMVLAAGLTYWFRDKTEEWVVALAAHGQVREMLLPDGTKVWLNSRSYLKHPTRFTGNTRDVVLNGEAYFSVHKDKSKRFTVSTPFDIKAEVLGTEFNMEAYAADSSVRTTLVSGSIRLSFLDDNQKHKSFLMKPNEEFTYNQYTKKVKVDKPYIPTQTSWKDGLVVFRNTPFNEALKVLSKRFNVEFIVKNDKLYNNSFTGPFDGQHLQLILEHFRLASGIQYRFIDPQTGQEGNIKEKTIVELY